jgi:predicted RNase H-like nuclease (RuvC/YqgF family)
MKSNYHEKKQARIDSYEDLASKKENLSTSLFNDVQKMGSVIPMGQPILVGHHSEKRDRNYRAKMDNKMRKSIEESNKADYYREKMKSALANTAISSDDPEALQKLKQKLESLQAYQEIMKAANSIIRNKKLSVEEKIERLQKELGLSQSNTNKLLEPDYAGRIGFATFSLSNNNQNMKSIKDRIAYLEQISKIETSEETINGVLMKVSQEDNRIQLFFKGKPSEAIRTTIKRNGFRWAPSVGAWMKFLSIRAIEQTRSLLMNMEL